jgi:hypothetical protein
MSLGTSLAVLDSIEREPESSDAPRSSGRPPTLPVWAPVPSLPSQLVSAGHAPWSAEVAPFAVPSSAEPEIALDEVIEFRAWPARRTWSIVAVLVLGAAIAVAVLTRTPGSADSVVNPVHPALPALAAQPVATASDSLRPHVPGSMLVPPTDDAHGRGRAGASTASARAPTPKAPAKHGAKDYGI